MTITRKTNMDIALIDSSQQLKEVINFYFADDTKEA